MELNGTTIIELPIENVYAHVSEVGHDVEWRQSLTESGMTSRPPLGLGSTGYARAGTTEVGWTVTAFGADRRIEWELTSGPFRGSGGYLFEPIGAKTRFTLLADVEPPGLMKLLGPLFARMGRRPNQGDVDRLKTLLETARPAT